MESNQNPKMGCGHNSVPDILIHLQFMKYEYEIFNLQLKSETTITNVFVGSIRNYICNLFIFSHKIKFNIRKQVSQI